MSQWSSPKLGTVEEVFTPRLHWKEGKDVEGEGGDNELSDLCDYSIGCGERGREGGRRQRNIGLV